MTQKAWISPAPKAFLDVDPHSGKIATNEITASPGCCRIETANTAFASLPEDVMDRVRVRGGAPFGESDGHMTCLILLHPHLTSMHWVRSHDSECGSHIKQWCCS